MKTILSTQKRKTEGKQLFIYAVFLLCWGRGGRKKGETPPEGERRPKKKNHEKRRILKNSEKFSGEERPEEGGEGRET